MARLIRTNPRAVALLHVLASRVGDDGNAVVVTIAECAAAMQCAPGTARRAMAVLAREGWLRVERARPGRPNAYVLGDWLA